MTLTEPLDAETHRVAVAIPCFNEAAAIAAVVAQWRAALPDAEIVVFDNNSTDGTGALARSLGVRVVEVPMQGKGHAVRAIFENLRDRDAVVLVDGDGTYPAEHVGPLLKPVLAGEADMAVGARRPVAELGAMTPVRGLGNLLIGAVFRVLIGPGTGDLLSGYRVFGPRFLKAFTPRSAGSRSRPSCRARRSPGGCGWSRSQCPTAPGSPARQASSASSATASASCSPSSRRACGSGRGESRWWRPW